MQRLMLQILPKQQYSFSIAFYSFRKIKAIFIALLTSLGCIKAYMSNIFHTGLNYGPKKVIKMLCKYMVLFVNREIPYSIQNTCKSYTGNLGIQFPQCIHRYYYI